MERQDKQGSGERQDKQGSGGILKTTLEVGRKLARVELDKTRETLRSEAQDALSGSMKLAGAGLLALGGLAALTLAGAKVLLENPGRAALLGIGLLGGAAGLTAMGLRKLPKRPLAQVGEQVRRDVQRVTGELS